MTLETESQVHQVFAENVFSILSNLDNFFRLTNLWSNGQMMRVQIQCKTYINKYFLVNSEFKLNVNDIPVFIQHASRKEVFLKVTQIVASIRLQCKKQSPSMYALVALVTMPNRLMKSEIKWTKSYETSQKVMSRNHVNLTFNYFYSPCSLIFFFR